jgi:hypothetical protein
MRPDSARNLTLSDPTDEFMSAVIASRQRFQASGGRRIAQDWLQSLGARLYVALPQPLLFDLDDYATLSGAANALLSAQLKIARHLVRTHTREHLLDLFCVPDGMAPFIDWEKFQNGSMTIARMDIVPTRDGYRFCEFNVHSAVGGGESFGCCRRICDALDLPLDESVRPPDYDLAELYARIARERGIDRLVILDSVMHSQLGYPRHDDLVALLQEKNPGCEVAEHCEDTYPPEWLDPEQGKRTLIHRMFTYDEITDDCAFFKRLCESGATITNTFEAELRMSKLWLSLLCEKQYRGLLDESECAAVDEFLPHSFALTENNLSAALEQKDQYVFKFNFSYGGEGVLIGANATAGSLEREIRTKGVRNWICQQFVEARTISMPYDDSDNVADHALVLGLYLTEGKPNGFFVRGSASSKIVNLTNGAGKMAWGLVLDSDQRRRFTDLVRNL